jgi:Cys-tRNA(Pro)/Cys-tRNA(Cys) deacylase
MSYDKVIEILTTSGVPFTMHEHPPLHTVAEMAEHLPFSPEQFVKTLAFKVKEQFWFLAATPGAARLDYRKIAAAYGISRSHIIRPEPAEVSAVLGFDQGGVCPIPTAAGVRVIVDPAAAALETVFCGGARNDRTLEIRMADLLRITGAAVQPIARDSDG